jgi:proteasome lid subunit RPN8/RPN11
VADYLSAPGKLLESSKLSIPKAKETVNLLSSDLYPYASLVECRKRSGDEVIVLDVQVERGQLVAHDIRHNERIAVVFLHEDQVLPEVLALRTDFPVVPHLNLRGEELPRSLCLYEERYEDLKRSWTAARFIERLRVWLAKTARGELHASDQPLEPLLLGTPVPLILPVGYLSSPPEHQLLYVSGVGKPLSAFIARSWNTAEVERQMASYIALNVMCSPQNHGTINRTPRTLLELHELTLRAGLDLVATLREELSAWRSMQGMLNARPILIVRFPKTRTEGGEIESTEAWAFLARQSIRDVGEQLGLWIRRGGGLDVLRTPDEARQGQGVDLYILNPTPALSVERASLYSGFQGGDGMKIAAVGGGALGSQVFMNLVRAGFGKWTVIDNDILLPHNLARHELDGRDLGDWKAAALARRANKTIQGGEVATAIITDVLNPRGEETALQQCFDEANTIVDMAASVTVARHLSHSISAAAKRISLFLNPSGTDLVLLAEDAGRNLTLDQLEMQYYRTLITHGGFATHLALPSEPVRYGRSCRDVSVRLPNSYVSLHAAIASRALPETLDFGDAVIRFWQWSEEETSVSAVKVKPVQSVVLRRGRWRIMTDIAFLTKIEALRAERLPNETGGTLVGSFDLERHIIYVVDTVPSPSDSVEWPTLYIRGRSGQREAFDDIKARTAGMLEYVGEWHSHPDGYSCTPSSDDRQVFAWLEEHMFAEGLPPVMLIAADKGSYGWYVDSL